MREWSSDWGKKEGRSEGNEDKDVGREGWHEKRGKGKIGGWRKDRMKRRDQEKRIGKKIKTRSKIYMTEANIWNFIHETKERKKNLAEENIKVLKAGRK